MTAELIVLRLIHILGGIFWVGSGLFTTFFLVPSLTSAGPAAGAVMGGLQKRRLFTILPIVALATILSGARLMWITSGGFRAEYFESRSGGTYAIAAAASIIAFLLSLAVSRPMAVRSAKLAGEIAQAPEGEPRARLAAELARVRRRGAVATTIGVSLLVIAGAGMAVARYL
jgi:uncharacterized membrane protein